MTSKVLISKIHCTLSANQRRESEFNVYKSSTFCHFSCLCHSPDWVSQLLCVSLVETEHSAVAMWFLSSSTLSPLLHSLPALQDFSFWLITFTSFSRSWLLFTFCSLQGPSCCTQSHLYSKGLASCILHYPYRLLSSCVPPLPWKV